MPRMPLKTHSQARAQLGKVIREFKLNAENDCTPPTVRTLGYLFQVLSQYYKLEMEAEYEARIEALEQFAETGGFERAKRETQKIRTTY